MSEQIPGQMSIFDIEGVTDRPMMGTVVYFLLGDKIHRGLVTSSSDKIDPRCIVVSGQGGVTYHLTRWYRSRAEAEQAGKD